MNKLLIALLSTALLAAPGLASANASDETNQAIAKAEADVKEARSKNALWTTAEDALKKAKELAEKGDNAGAQKQAKKASEQAQLGIGQLSYPSTAPKSK